MADAGSNHKAVRYWENVSHTISWVNDSASKVPWRNWCLSALLRASNLSIECEGCLNTNKKPLNIECFEHNLCHLFSVLWRIHWRLSQNEIVLLRLTLKVRVDRSMPELFYSFPVLDLATSQNATNLMSLLSWKNVITNVEVKLRVLECGWWASCLLYVLPILLHKDKITLFNESAIVVGIM